MNSNSNKESPTHQTDQDKEQLDELVQELLSLDYDCCDQCDGRLDKAKLTLIQYIQKREDKPYKKVNRFEVIDEEGRAYVKGSVYGSPVKIRLSYQDNNRTLKVFVTNLKEGNHE